MASMADLTPKCPTICHFGRKDAHIPADEIRAILQAAQPQVAVYIYEKSGHGFNNDGRPDSDPDEMECEELTYAGGSAYKTLTGDFGPPRVTPLPAAPSGEEWEESIESLRSRFPRLAAHWGMV